MQTRVLLPGDRPVSVPTCVNEFWTSKQRAAHSLHEVSYRACFKPQLPRFFIERLTRPGDIVYDPFMGRGTTLIEAALLDRIPAGCDVNPLSEYLVRPRLNPPALTAIRDRLAALDLSTPGEMSEDLLVFYHPDTLRELSALKAYLLARQADGSLDEVDRWIWMVGLNRLTGHSPGFFSVYSLPPNQAVSVKSQRRINQRRNQVPPRREVPKIILKKSKQLLGDLTPSDAANLRRIVPHATLLTTDSSRTHTLPVGSVALVVTSPPFLNIVQYAIDNWLRCWFIGIDAAKVALTVPSKLDAWRTAMTGVFHELFRVLRPGGHVAFEVGEISGGSIRLEEAVVPCGIAAGLEPILILINEQEFTKTANCWGIDNNQAGTNSNRIVVFTKPPANPAR